MAIGTYEQYKARLLAMKPNVYQMCIRDRPGLGNPSPGRLWCRLPACGR